MRFRGYGLGIRSFSLIWMFTSGQLWGIFLELFDDVQTWPGGSMESSSNIDKRGNS